MDAQRILFEKDIEQLLCGECRMCQITALYCPRRYTDRACFG